MAKRQTKTSKPAPVKRSPHSGSLPGLEDHAIEALDNIAADYADIRDSRMDLTRQESEMKKRAMALMKKHGKTRYAHNGVTIDIVPGEEDIKVRVKKASEDLDDSDTDAPSEPPADDTVSIS